MPWTYTLPKTQRTKPHHPHRPRPSVAAARPASRPRHTPQKIISVAEVLEPQVKTRIEQRFGTPVHQIYQCTEGFLAHTCAHGNLHLNEDMVYIEKDWIDRESGRFAPIITDFNRKSQPVIRYRLDDVLISDDAPCPCGSAFARISAIEGRCDDILDARTANGEPYALTPDSSAAP